LDPQIPAEVCDIKPLDLQGHRGGLRYLTADLQGHLGEDFDI
jgi:hypothetical protein